MTRDHESRVVTPIHMIEVLNDDRNPTTDASDGLTPLLPVLGKHHMPPREWLHLPGILLDVRVELERRTANERYWRTDDLPKNVAPLVSVDDAVELLSRGSRVAKGPIEHQRLSQMLGDGVSAWLTPEGVAHIEAINGPTAEEMLRSEAHELLPPGKLGFGVGAAINTLASRHVRGGGGVVVKRADVEALLRGLEADREGWITRREAAERLGISQEAVRRWAERHEIPQRRFAGGSRYLISEEAVEAKAKAKGSTVENGSRSTAI